MRIDKRNEVKKEVQDSQSISTRALPLGNNRGGWVLVGEIAEKPAEARSDFTERKSPALRNTPSLFTSPSIAYRLTLETSQSLDFANALHQVT